MGAPRGLQLLDWNFLLRPKSAPCLNCCRKAYRSGETDTPESGDEPAESCGTRFLLAVLDPGLLGLSPREVRRTWAAAPPGCNLLFHPGAAGVFRPRAVGPPSSRPRSPSKYPAIRSSMYRAVSPLVRVEVASTRGSS
jgi:hypothetical protein